MAICPRCNQRKGTIPRDGERYCTQCNKQIIEELRIAANPGSAPDGVPLITANGIGGAINVFPGKIVILRKGLLATLSHGSKGDKEIYIRQISSIQIKKPGLTNGYIQFAFVGGQEAKAGVFQAASDENSVMFSAGQHKEFINVKAEIERQLNEIHAPARAQAQPVISPADELAKYAKLRDAGVISEEEFGAKKKQLLGL